MKKIIRVSLLLAVLTVGLQGSFMHVSAQTVDFTYAGVCVDSPTTFSGTFTGPTTAVTWTWSFGDGNFGAGQNTVHTYTAFNISGGYTVLLTVVDNLGDTYVSVPKYIEIQPLPIPFFSANGRNCSNDSIQFLDHSSTIKGNITQWVWNFGDGTPAVTVNFPNDPNVKHVFNGFGIFSVTLSLTTSLGCVNQASLPVTIIPSPVANFYFYGKCEDQLVQFNDASSAFGSGNIVAWSWDFDDPSSGINNTSDKQNPTHLFSLPGSYFVKLTATNFNNCTDTIIKEVKINPHPPVDFIFTPSCLNELIYFDPDTNITNIAAITTWAWTFGDGGTSPARNTAHAYTATGTYTVTLTITDTAGCMNTVSHNVTVYPLPIAHFDAGITNCAGALVTFNNLSSTSPGAGYILRWEWDFGDGNHQTIVNLGNPNVTHIYPLPGIYIVTLKVTSSDSCSNFETQQITIHPNPLANFDWTKPVCDGTLISFTDLTQANGGGSLIQWLWDFGDPITGIANSSLIPNPEHQFSGPGTYNVLLQVSTGNGCSDTISYQITVKPKPVVDFTSQNNCQNNAVLFLPNNSVMSPGAIQTWSWTFGDGGTSPLQSPTHVFATSGNFNVTLTVTDTAGCINHITKTIAVVPEPISNFTYVQPSCSQSAVQFNSLANAPVGYIVKWVWTFGDSGTQTILFPGDPNITHTYSTYGTFNVTLTVTTNDSCTKSYTKPVIIVPNPLANFSFETTCAGSPVQFNDLSQSGSGGIVDWSWNFGDPASGSNNISTQQNPQHTFLAPAIYNVTLIITNTGGCRDTVLNKPVLVHALPAVDFSAAAGCVNDSTHFVSTGFVTAPPAQSWIWNFGDGITSTDKDPYHIYASSGAFTVTLTVTDTAGCINEKLRVVTITPPPDAFFQVSTNTCANNPVNFNDISTLSGGSFTSWFWDFGDGSDTLINAPSNPDITHIYLTAGTFTVVLKVNTSQGCEDSYTKTITVTASPVANFIFDNTCEGSAVEFTNQSTVNGGTVITGYLWNFGDPGSGTNNTSTLENPLHIYATPGTYIVLLQTSNADGCPDTTSHPLTVHAKPAVDYSWQNTCLGTITEFTVNTSVTVVAAVQTFDWDFGDGTPHSAQQDPTHNYTVAGNYIVTLMITDTAGCINQKSYPITINPQPTAAFGFSSGCLNTPVHFNDQSFTSNGEPIENWHWDFGIGTATIDTSNLQNPVWTYTTLGIYTVTLIVTSQSGCQDTTQVSVQVFGRPTASYSYTAAPCNNGAVYFQDSSYNQQAVITGWNWQFEPGQFSTLQNPVYVFHASDSCYIVRLIVTDNRGCADTSSQLVCVPAPLVVNFQASPTCFQDTTYFTSQLITPIGDSLAFFNWNFGDPASGINNTSTFRNPSHLYTQPGTYTVIFETTDTNNCLAQRNLYVTVDPLPVAQFAFNSGLCDSTMYFTQTSSGSGSSISTWLWSFGDGTTDTVTSADSAVFHKYPAPGNYQVKLTVTNSKTCQDTITQQVFVNPCIDAVFVVNDTICQNYPLAFADSSYSGLPVTNWYWNFGDGTDTSYTSYINPLTHAFTQAGNYTIKMVISTSLLGKSISDSTQLNVLVQPSPAAAFSFGKVCLGTPAPFTNATSTNGVPVSGYYWSFGDPTSAPADTSTMRNASHNYSAIGYYNVQLVATNLLGCKDTTLTQLQVNPLPIAAFSNSLSCAGDRTDFTDLSDSAVAPLSNWSWTFSGTEGLLGYGTGQTPSFTFPAPGNYNVNLMVSDTNGCIDTLNKSVTTYIVPTSIFSYNENFDNIQGQLHFENISLNGVKYYWDFGNGESSYAEKPVSFYQEDGTYTISLITWSDMNCSDTTTLDYTFLVKGLYIPNAFSPNNPHEEVTLFKPVGLNLKTYRIEVYDNWGNEIWSSTKLDDAGRPLEGWDGKYNGSYVQEGVYVWKASAVFTDGTIWNNQNIGTYEPMPQTVYGTVTLIR